LYLDLREISIKEAAIIRYEKPISIDDWSTYGGECEMRPVETARDEKKQGEEE
jgi:hypothetical protein